MIRSNLFPVLVFFAASLMSCSFFSQGTKIEFVLAQTPKFELNKIDALKVGQFKGQPLVKISLPVEAEGPPNLSPGVLSFDQEQNPPQKIPQPIQNNFFQYLLEVLDLKTTLNFEIDNLNSDFTIVPEIHIGRRQLHAFQ